MTYEDLPPIGRDELARALAGHSGEEAARGLLRMALNDGDWRWAEQKCLEALHDQRKEVRAAAVTGLGHVARRHGRVTTGMVVPVLRALHNDPDLGGLAEDALEDILLFTTTSPSES